jgi:hypothetical protein
VPRAQDETVERHRLHGMSVARDLREAPADLPLRPLDPHMSRDEEVVRSACDLLFRERGIADAARSVGARAARDARARGPEPERSHELPTIDAAGAGLHFTAS